MFDSFDHAAERRMERGLIARYEGLTEALLAALDMAVAAALATIAINARRFAPNPALVVRLLTFGTV